MPVSSVVVKDINIETTTNNNYYQNDGYAKEFFGQNDDSLQGWTVDQWVMRAGYYRDAIEVLSKEELEFKDGVPLLNQKEIAIAVEDWVAIRFLSKTKFNTLKDIDSKYNKAYLGYLYFQAVEILKEDGFTVLGQIDAAAAIARYVRNKFMEVIYRGQKNEHI